MNIEKRISSKELKQPDRIQESLYKIVNYIYKYRNQFIAGGVLTGVVFLSIWGGYEYYLHDQEQKSNSFVEALKSFEDTKLSETEKQNRGIESLQQFLLKTPNHFLSVVSLMQMGEFYVKQGQWKSAEEVFQQAIQHPKSSEFIKNVAKMSLGGVLENQGKWKEAKMIVESIEGSLWEDIRLKMLARISLAQGDAANAKVYLQQLINMEIDASLKQQAELMLITIN